MTAVDPGPVTPPAIDGRPRLAVMFTPRVLVMQLVEVATGSRHLLWVVDRSVAGVEEHMRALQRLGTVIDITDCDTAESAMLVGRHRPNGIIAFGEDELMKAALLGAALGLPSNHPDVVARLVNKAEQRKALKAAGMAVPQHWTISRSASRVTQQRLAAEINYPAIIKPQAGAGSRDTRRLPDAEALLGVLAEFAAGPAREPDDDFIIEELLPDGWPRDSRPYADFVSVESIVCDGQISHLAVTGRARLAEPFLETGNFVPANLPAMSVDAVLATTAQAIAAVGATTGCFHTEVKLTPAGPRIIEINGRVGGSIPELIALATGQSLLEIACRVALGERLRFESLLPCTQVGYSLIVPPPRDATRLLALDNLDSLRAIPGVSALLVNRAPGDPIDWREGYDGRIYTVYGSAPDHEAMWTARDEIKRSVKMTVD